MSGRQQARDDLRDPRGGTYDAEQSERRKAAGNNGQDGAALREDIPEGAQRQRMGPLDRKAGRGNAR